MRTLRHVCTILVLAIACGLARADEGGEVVRMGPEGPAVRLPGTPVHRRVTTRHGLSEVESDVVEASVGRARLAMARSKVPGVALRVAGEGFVLRTASDAVIRAHGADATDHTTVRRHGHYGRRTSYAFERGGRAFTGTLEVFVVDGAVLTLDATVPADARGPSLAAFFGSVTF